MARTARYDAIVIGSGQAGSPLAKDLAEAGWKTALVEREHIGGTCVNVGCTPTKTMIASARVAWLARRAGDYGVRTGRVSVDMAKVRARKRAIVERFGGVTPDEVERVKGRDVLYGEARFVGPRTIEVALAKGGPRRLEAEHVVIDTGTRPARPELEGLADVAALDSTSVMELARVPEHLVVLGGGYVGVEFAQMFRRFGSRVTIVQRGPALLAREDRDVAEAVAEILREDGVEVLLGAAAERVERDGVRKRGGGGGRRAGGRGRGGALRLRVRQEGRARSVRGSHLLVAAGRTPNTDRLNLAAAGVEADERGYVRVDERLRTSAAGVYAAGDVKGGPAFTHVSYDDYRVLRANLLEEGSATTSGRLLPYVVFTDPELGRVGMTETEAREQGKRVRVAKMGMDSVARALERDEPRGFLKVVVDATSDRILGCAMLGVEGGELMSMLEIAMMGGVTTAQLREAVLAHPTMAEALNNLFYAFEGE